MMTKEEIMKVLDAMNYAISPSGTFWVKKHNEAKQILQAALAEPSEPLIKFKHGCKWCGKLGECEHTHPEPSKPEPLTDEEISEVFEKCASLQAIPGNGRHTVHSALVGVAEGIEFARAVEAAVLEKLK